MAPDHTDFDSLHQIQTGKHLYQFYKSADDCLHMMIPFFRCGLEKGDTCLWLVSKRIGLEHVRKVCERLFPNFSLHLASGQLQIRSAEEWYLTDGSFDEAKALRNAEQYLARTQEHVFKRLRASGDAGAVPRGDWDKVYAYELKIASWIKSQPVIALCAYPILECTPSQTKSVLECHEDVLVGRI